MNGAMRAVNVGAASPVCAVLPAGNANDHYSSVARRPLIEALQEGAVTHLDLLAVQAGEIKRYAHSYAGLGLSPLVARELNRHSLSALREMWLMLKMFWRFRPFEVQLNGQRCRFDSIVAGNIGRMAKHLTLAEDSSPKDGQFEIITIPHVGKLRLLFKMLQSALGRGPAAPKINSLAFTPLQDMPIQLDGEVMQLRGGAEVVISAAAGKLKTIR